VSAEEAKILAAEVTLRQLSTSGQATAFPEGTVSTVCVRPVQSYALKCILVDHHGKKHFSFFILSLTCQI
jgi:hypothetical protein